MAANYTKVSSHQTEELVGGTTLQDVLEVGFFTIPSNVYAQARIPVSGFAPSFLPDFIATQLGILATEIESIATDPQVAAVVFVQDVSAAGQLIDVLEITVTSTSGLSSGIVRVQLTSFAASIATPLIVAEQAALDAIEAL